MGPWLGPLGQWDDAVNLQHPRMTYSLIGILSKARLGHSLVLAFRATARLRGLLGASKGFMGPLPVRLVSTIF